MKISYFQRFSSLLLCLVVGNIQAHENKKYIKKFQEINLHDIPLVGGKNASLGEMISQLHHQDVLVPLGFAITAEAYWYVLESNNITQQAKALISTVDPEDLDHLQEVAAQVRSLIESATIPQDLADEIIAGYLELSQLYRQDECDVAVRSSATAEDLPNASFAGQQDTFLNVHGSHQILHAYKKCLASLFTDRAIAYRIEQGFDHFDVGLSVGIQKMIRSDLSCSGVAFSIDTESGFKDTVLIESSYGLGEGIVGGLVSPDQYMVHKPTFKQGYASIIKKRLGIKNLKVVYSPDGNKNVETIPVEPEYQKTFALSDEDIKTIAHAVMIIEDHYTHLKGAWSPMDVEWAKDGLDGRIYITQARPETVHSQKENQYNVYTTYALNPDAKQKAKILVTGQSVGQQISSGIARIVKEVSEISKIKSGEIIVTEMTDPDWVPAMKKSAGIITNRGGRTCHAAIVSRELGIPAIVGAEDATELIQDGEEITLDCSSGSIGKVYKGRVPYAVNKFEIDINTKLPLEVMVNIADPESALKVAQLPSSGVGLARLEFVISNALKVHPMALIHPEKVIDLKVKEEIAEVTAAYPDGPTFFVETLAQSIAMIGAAFYPRPVIVRLSDFKTNEYRGLLGGIYFEPEEENPMIGFRGASRYYHDHYKEGFALECAAMKKVREEMGLTNVKAMIPFVRTTDEAKGVLNEMAKNGLKRGDHGLEVIMMCEIPSNVILAKQFLKLFDGFSIGSNDLTQLTLGVDRDSGILASHFDERNPAVLKMFKKAIREARIQNRYIGICGQAPSDHPDLARYLIDCGIGSLSLNPDSILPFIMSYMSK